MNYKKFLFFALLMSALVKSDMLNGLTQLDKRWISNTVMVQFPCFILRNMLYNLYLEKSQAHSLSVAADCYLQHILREVLLIKENKFFDVRLQVCAHTNLALAYVSTYIGPQLASMVKKYLPSSVDQHDAEQKVLSNENH